MSPKDHHLTSGFLSRLATVAKAITKASKLGITTKRAENWKTLWLTIYPIGMCAVAVDGCGKKAENNDKLAYKNTLHEVLTIVCRLVAPVSPFMVDVIYRNLTGLSVHQADWPLGTPVVYLVLPLIHGMKRRQRLHNTKAKSRPRV